MKLSTMPKLKLRNLINDIKAIGSGKNLDKLGKIYGTDKKGSHFYTPHYMTHLERFRYRKINLLELGVGGYKNPHSGGKSLRMWKKYFPFGNIFSIDIYDKSSLQEDRITIFKGSQIDKIFLNKVTEKIILSYHYGSYRQKCIAVCLISLVFEKNGYIYRHTYIL